MDLYRGHFDLSSLQPPYSLLNRTIETRELPYCLKHNIGVINYSPLFRRLLGGRYHADSDIEGARASGPYFHGEGLRIITEAVDMAKEMAVALDLTVAQLALRWTLTNHAITSAIVGGKEARPYFGKPESSGGNSDPAAMA